MTTATTNYPMLITNVPAEIAFPANRPHNCHGLTLVHGCDGKPRNYYHEVSVAAGSAAEEWATIFGYEQRSGFRVDGRQHWVYGKEYDLQVAGWVF